MGGCFEMTGGVRVVLTPKNIERNVKGALLSTTVGSALRDARGSIAVTCDGSTTKVGGVLSASGGKTIVLRGDRVRLEAAGGVKLQSGGAVLDLAPGRAAIEGEVKTEVPAISMSGATLDLTKA
jgi:hypothetical protein